MSKALEKLKQGAKKIISDKNAEISLLKTALTKANGEKAVVFKMPDSLEVRNFPEIQKVKIENHPDVVKTNVLNLKDINIKFPDVQKVQIVENQKELIQKITIDNTEKVAMWAPKIATAIMKGFANLWARGLTVKLDDEERLKPLPVIIVDTRGRPVGVQSPSNVVIPMGGGGVRKDSSADFNLGTYDDVVLTYTGSNLTGVTYSYRGRTTAVLALSYDGSNNLIEARRTS